MGFILRLFGAKFWPSKLVLKSFAPWFENSNKAVRDEVFALVLEMYKWHGAVVQKQTESLRPAQVKELNEAFAGIVPNSATAERLLRSEAAKLASAAPVAASTATSGGSVSSSSISGM